MMIIPGREPDVRMHSRVLMQPFSAPRCGIMLHYDDSSSDASALEWFHDPRHQWLHLARARRRTRRGADSRWYGIAAVTNGSVPATERQLNAIARLSSNRQESAFARR